MAPLPEDPNNKSNMDQSSVFQESSAVIVTSAVAASLFLYWITRPRPIVPQIDFKNQSEVLAESKEIRVSPLAPNGKFIEKLSDKVTTLYDILYSGAKASNNGNCLGAIIEKKINWLSYNETIEKAKNIGSGITELKLKPADNYVFIGIFAKNSVEWVVTEQACYHYSMVCVPLYDTLGKNACNFIIHQAEIQLLICDSEAKVDSLIDEAGEIKTLKYIALTVPEIKASLREKANKNGIKLMTFQELEDLGIKHPHGVKPPSPKDLATVCYTSGTTGMPKGVMLTHGQIMSNVSAVMYQLGDIAPRLGDRMLSFLPLAHMFERCCETGCYMVGASVGFYRGDIRVLNEDMKTLKPTVTPTVPRLLNRIYDKVLATAKKSKVKECLLKMAISSKSDEISRRIIRNNSFWDYLVFKKVREEMGGCVRMMLCGSAPLSPNVRMFMQCALGCPVIEGYGQTECVSPCTLTFKGDPDPGHVGPPLGCCHIKLVDVPEMEYYAKDGKGEVCVRGPSVFSGYLKDPAKTAEVLDSDGWLHSGDIGQWLENGALKIIDRKKNIFKLSQGEYIAPEKIENVYMKSSFVSQIFVYGESLKSTLVAVIVPEKDVLLKWCSKKHIQFDWSKIMEKLEVKKAILSDLAQVGEKEGLKSFEQVKDIYVTPDPFTIENGLLTPTLKTKRPECRKYFMNEIEIMYKTLI